MHGQLNSPFFVDGQETNGGSQASHEALTPSQPLLSNSTSSHSGVEGQLGQQHGSSSLQATEPAGRRRRHRRLLTEPVNDHESYFEDDQPCSSGIQPYAQHRRCRLLTERPNNDHGSCFEDDQPCSSGMQPNAQHRRRRLLTERPNNDHGSWFEDDQPCSSGMQPNAKAQRLPQHQLRRDMNQGSYI